MFSVDVVFRKGLCKGVENWIAAHSMVQRPVCIVSETLEHLSLLISVKSVDNFVCVSNESINVVDGLTQGRGQKANPQREAGAVGFGGALGAL